MPDLSIVLPTCNRAEHLLNTIMEIERRTHIDYELIVVDGASSDSTGDVLQLAHSILGQHLRVIREPKREGFVRAANKGFRAASGEFITWINDDARPTDGAYDRAVDQISFGSSQTGLIALYHAWHREKNVAYQAHFTNKSYQLCHVRGTLYANFGLAKRETFERLGYFDERYYMNAADPDFSLKVWNAGLKVVPAIASFIDHDELNDARRSDDSIRAGIDNEALFLKWDLPEKSNTNDFDPNNPCTLRKLRSTSMAA